MLCRDYINVITSVVWLNAVMLNVVILNVIMLNVVMMSVVMMNVVMLSVVAPCLLKKVHRTGPWGLYYRAFI